VSGLADHGQSREWLSHGGIPHGLDAFDNGGRTERRAVRRQDMQDWYKKKTLGIRSPPLTAALTGQGGDSVLNSLQMEARDAPASLD
jgi:hypothetical protein